MYLLEPSEHLHAPLRKSLAEASQLGKRSEGLADKTTLIPAGVQDFDMLKRNFITKETIDTLVCVQVLCSIPNPMSHIQTMVTYLKPGGKLILVSAGVLITRRGPKFKRVLIRSATFLFRALTNSTSTCARQTTRHT